MESAESSMCDEGVTPFQVQVTPFLKYHHAEMPSINYFWHMQFYYIRNENLGIFEESWFVVVATQHD